MLCCVSKYIACVEEGDGGPWTRTLARARLLCSPVQLTKIDHANLGDENEPDLNRITLTIGIDC